MHLNKHNVAYFQGGSTNMARCLQVVGREKNPHG